MLKQALNLELWMITLYEDYLNRINDVEIKKGIQKLIYESTGHASDMRHAIHKLKLKSPIKRKLSKEKIRELLNTGMKEEVDAQLLYTNIAKTVNDKEIKKVAEKIYKDEVRHEKIVKKLIKLTEK